MDHLKNENQLLNKENEDFKTKLPPFLIYKQELEREWNKKYETLDYEFKESEKARTELEDKYQAKEIERMALQEKLKEIEDLLGKERKSLQAKIENIQSTVTQFEDREQSLTKKVNSSKEKEMKLMDNIDQLENLNKELKDKISIVEEALQREERSKTHLLNENNRLLKENRNLSNWNQELKEELEAIKTSYQHLDENYKTVNQEYEAVVHKNSALKDEIKESNTRYGAKNKQLTEDLNHLNETLQQQYEKENELNQQISLQQKNRRDWEGQYKELERNNERLKKENQNLAEQLKEIESQMEQMVEAHQANHHKELEQKEIQLHEQLQCKQDLEEKLSSSLKKERVYQQEIDQLKKETVNLMKEKQTILGKSDLTQPQLIKELIVEIDHYSKKAADGLETIERLEKEIDFLQSELVKLKSFRL
ncbi:hypothetical protein [Halobacillus sp. BBL2006]|uniref:hypothetical protein n=1 Tax=Halobacillus sp. BBL2006 TaxID=1543706 RepID=UPI0012E09E3E|nr:hypothetical protein [Halobacillus sp. BBL2006]